MLKIKKPKRFTKHPNRFVTGSGDVIDFKLTIDRPMGIIYQKNRNWNAQTFFAIIDRINGQNPTEQMLNQMPIMEWVMIKHAAELFYSNKEVDIQDEINYI